MAKIMLFFGMLAAAVAANAASVFVKIGASGAADGTSWANAYTDIGAALAAAEAGDTLYVAGGTYSVTASLPYKAVAIYGGFAGDEAAPNPAARQLTPGGKPWEFVNPTVIDASGWSGNNDPIFATPSSATALTLDGLTIQNRTVSNATPSVTTTKQGLTIRRCIVKDNKSTQTSGSGVALYIEANGAGEVVIKDSKFEGNEAWDGGAIFVNAYSGNVIISISGCLFTKNVGTGAVAWMKSGTMLVANSEFISNDGRFQAGAFKVDGGTATFANSIFKGNKAGKNSTNKDWVQGGAIHRLGGSVAVYSCVFDGNGCYNDYQKPTIEGSNVVLYNSIFINSDGKHFDNATASYCMFDKDVPAGEGNIAYSEGVFTNAAAGDYTLAENSPAKGKGKFTIPNSKTSWGQTVMGAYGGEWTESPYFHIVFERRGDALLKDNGAGSAVTAHRVYPANPSLLTDALKWRFIREGSYVRVQSGLGSYLDLEGSAWTTQAAITTDARTIFKFVLSNNFSGDNGPKGIFLNLYANYPSFSTAMNKSSGNSNVGTYVNLGDDGNAISLAPSEAMEAAMPQLDKYYQIYALRGHTSIQSATQVWQGAGESANITLQAPNDTITKQLWKFVAAPDGVNIQSLDGGLLKASDNNTQTVSSGGDVFTLAWSQYSKNTTTGGVGPQQHFSVYNATKGGSQAYVCGSLGCYWYNTSDHEVEFVPVAPSVTLSADTLKFGSFFESGAAAVKTFTVSSKFITDEIETSIEYTSGASGFSVA
ncbi:MAG: hypothetical protein LBO71_05730, partial [Prevotellaceae bacterium]|nr:hypothetical protein [Prevotellaceae bacterium]